MDSRTPADTEPAVMQADPLLKFFGYAHLPDKLRTASEPFGELAQRIVDTLPRNPERTVALRKLLEAKDAAVRTLLTLVAVVGLLLALSPAPARAAESWGHVCLMGCEEPDAPTPKGLAASSSAQLSPVMWLRPSLGLTVAVRDGLTRAWTVGLEPGVGYGVAWSPPGWTRLHLSPELLSLDVHASAALTGGTLAARLLLMLSGGGLVTVGAGVDCALGSGTTRDRCGLALAVGARVGL